MKNPSSPITKHLRLFLCHSSGDKPKVRKLYARLREDGFAPWLDEIDLLPGQNWQEEIHRSVRASHVVIVCLSRDSVTKEGYVQKEIKFALDAADEKPSETIFLIPARLEEVGVPARLARWHWVNLFDAGGYEHLLRALGVRATSIKSQESSKPQQQREPSPERRSRHSSSSEATLKMRASADGRIERILKGHSAGIMVVAASGDGRRAISTSADNTLKVWDLETGEVMHTLKYRSNYVDKVAISADGTRAISGSLRNVNIWNLDNGQRVGVLKAHSKLILSLAISADGRHAVSASFDDTVKMWDLRMGLEVRTLKAPEECKNIAVCLDAGRVVSVLWDDTLKVWDMASGRTLRVLKGNSGSVDAVAVSSDGRRIVWACNDKTVKIWDLYGGRAVHTLKGHSRPIVDVSVRADGQRAVSISGTTLKVWDLVTFSSVATINFKRALLCCAFCAPKHIIAGDNVGQVFIRQIEE